MPQFEVEASWPESVSGLFRGRTPAEAFRRALDLPETTPLDIAEEADLHGWRAVEVDDRPAGRIRAHQRMRFRRD